MAVSVLSMSGFQSQICSVMEALANAAVEELCKLVELNYSLLHSELLSQQKENLSLRRRLKNIEIREGFYRRAHRLGKPPGRMVRVKIRSAETPRSEGVEAPKTQEDLIPPPTQESTVVHSVEDTDSDVLIIKEERVENSKRKEPNLKPNLQEEPESQYVPDDDDDFLEQDSTQIGQSECDEQGQDFLKEEHLEQHVAENSIETHKINGNPHDERCPEAEPETDLHSASNAPWDSGRFDQPGHSLSYTGPDCSAGTSHGEFYIHGDTGETLCHYGSQIGLSTSSHSNMDGGLVPSGEDLDGSGGMGSQSEVPPFKSGFPLQLLKQRFICKFCGKAFPQTSALVLHQRVHTGEKPYYCTLCGKRFSQSSSLKKHHSIHLGEKPFRCVHCGKQFSDQSNLRKHVNVHTGEKPYGCSQCGKTFNQSSNLKTHMKIHTREKPFACERCGQIFAYKNSLAKHQQRNCLLPPSALVPFYTSDHQHAHFPSSST